MAVWSVEAESRTLREGATGRRSGVIGDKKSKFVKPRTAIMAKFGAIVQVNIEIIVDFAWAG